MLDYRIHPEHRLILLRLSGRLSVEDILEFLTAVMADGEYDTTYRSLVDLCGLAVTFTVADIDRLVRFSTVPATDAVTRCAVVTNSFFRAKLANISNVLSGRRHVAIRGFTEFGGALRWLEIDAAALCCVEAWASPALSTAL